jgi:hypothetical protein
MFTVILLFALVFVCLAAAIALSTAVTQSAFYERQVDGIIWRAPAAAAILTLFLIATTFLDAKFPNRFGSLFQFPLIETQEFDQFWSERTTDAGKNETHFHRQFIPPGRIDYVDANGRRWQRSDSGIVTAIIVEENGERRRFEAKLAPDGTFLRDPDDPNKTLDVEYVEEGGKSRIMNEAAIGKLTSTRVGAFCFNLLVNLLHLMIWIIVFALLMDIQWRHAILLGLAGWAITLLVVWSPIQSWVANALKAPSG